MSNTLQDIGRHLTYAIQPLDEAFRDTEKFRQLIYKLGWDVSGVPPSYLLVADKVSQAVSKLSTILSSSDPQLTDFVQLLEKIKDAYDAIIGITDAPPGVSDAGAFIAEFSERLFELLLTEYLSRHVPTAYGLLTSLEIIERVSVSGTTQRPSFIYQRINWEQIPEIFKNPGLILERVYGWNTDELKFNKIINDLYQVLFMLRLPMAISPMTRELQNRFYDPPPAVYRERSMLKVPYHDVEIAGHWYELAIALLELPKEGTKKPGFIIQPIFPRNVTLDVNLTAFTKLQFLGDTNVLDAFGILIRPEEITVRFPGAPGTTITAAAGVKFIYAPTQPKVLLGDSNATNLSLKGFEAGVKVVYDNGNFEVIIDAELKGLALVIAASESDGFLRRLLGDTPQKLDFPLGIEWSSVRGVRFKGGGGFEVSLHPHLQLGPVSIDTVQIRLNAPISESPEIKLEMGADIKAELGPLKLTVQNIGFEMKMNFDGGNAGPFGIDAAFKWPNGVGIAIDGGGFKGGGFLSIDVEKGEYTGVLELQFKGTLALRAIGIINTKMPDGSAGFSLLIIITAEFTPIQLGFGFTLNGVGGLLGLNRTMLIDPLREGVRTGSLNSILFPTNIVANAARIISDIKQIFPIQESRFVFGPMAKLGWGTPTLISIELGLLIEVPDPVRIAILGVIKVVLPDEAADLVRIQVNFLGVIDFEKQELAFDASLFNSRILTFTLTGDMVLRIGWGNNPNFLLSVGGFHPAFVPPPMSLPQIRRLTLSLLEGNNPRLTVEAYFAVTSNTVQFGAKAELYAEAGPFYIHGLLGFDVLFQFNPFYFNARVYITVDVRAGSTTLFCIELDLTLEGPTPWHAKGKASFRILFIKISVSFNVTWGEERTDTLPPVEVLPLLREALAKKGNWRAVIPTGVNQLVTIKEIETTDDVIVHPAGTLQITQKIVPLGIPIKKFGNQQPSGASEFKITLVELGTEARTAAKLKEQFAPAQFFEMNDADKISRKSFEEYEAGVAVNSSSAAKCSYATVVPVEHELIYAPERRPLLFIGLQVTLFPFFLLNSAAAKSSLSYARRKRSTLAAPEVKVRGENFGIASTENLGLYGAQHMYDTETEAIVAMNRLLASNPGLTGSIQVIPAYQINS